jgi:hypothetical protein
MRQGERILAEGEANDRQCGKSRDDRPMLASTRADPDNFPAQHLKGRGVEAGFKPAPMSETPGYGGSDKLERGGNSRIGHAMARAGRPGRRRGVTVIDSAARGKRAGFPVRKRYPPGRASIDRRDPAKHGRVGLVN